MVQFTARDKAATRAYRLVPGVTILEQEPLPYPLRLEARGKLDYFAKRQGFSLWGILTNPMILITGVVLLLGYAMPKLTEGIGTAAAGPGPRCCGVLTSVRRTVWASCARAQTWTPSAPKRRPCSSSSSSSNLSRAAHRRARPHEAAGVRSPAPSPPVQPRIQTTIRVVFVQWPPLYVSVQIVRGNYLWEWESVNPETDWVRDVLGCSRDDVVHVRFSRSASSCSSWSSSALLGA